MGIVDINNASTREEGPNYNKFDIEKNDKARIVIPNGKIAQNFVHSLYRSAPTLTEDNGRTRKEWESSSFSGSVICTGDFDKVASSPSYGDPDGCAACKAMHDGGVQVATAPRKTFALNVIQYTTKKNEYAVRNLNVDVCLWKHSDDKKINPIKTALGETEKPISQIDFLIEADGSMFKKWQITFTHPPAYAKNDQLKEAVKAAMDNELYSEEDLIAACGQQLTREALEAKIREVRSQVPAALTDTSDGMFTAAATSVTKNESASDDLSGLEELGKTQESDLETLVADDVSSLENLL